MLGLKRFLAFPLWLLSFRSLQEGLQPLASMEKQAGQAWSRYLALITSH